MYRLISASTTASLIGSELVMPAPSTWQFGGKAVLLFFTSLNPPSIWLISALISVCRAFLSAPVAATTIKAASIPMIVITTRSSTSVKPLARSFKLRVVSMIQSFTNSRQPKADSLLLTQPFDQLHQRNKQRDHDETHRPA